MTFAEADYVIGNLKREMLSPFNYQSTTPQLQNVKYLLPFLRSCEWDSNRDVDYIAPSRGLLTERLTLLGESFAMYDEECLENEFFWRRMPLLTDLIIRLQYRPPPR